MTEELKQKAKESATNYVQQLVDHSRIIENDLLLQCQLRQSHQDGYITGATEVPNELQEENKKAKEIIEKLLNVFASNDFFEEEELDAMAEAE